MTSHFALCECVDVENPRENMVAEGKAFSLAYNSQIHASIKDF